MNLANKFSFIRLLLTPLFVLSMLYYRADNAVLAGLPIAIFISAIITDAVDGYIARRYGQASRLGAILDPLADKFLIVVSFITLTFVSTVPGHLRIPPWVLIIVLTRDLFILTGASAILMMFGSIEFKPSLIGKFTTFLQMMTILAVLLRFNYSNIIWSAAALFTVASGIYYLVRTNRMLNETVKHK
ncbi:MAG: CDP-alcohol phosphatidyltransferase family protein [Candidatus Omnitrophica bacterium]|nr:CDP-alcohol phosphatidyltransferase family protein [Candidatus Omnitrophota bacterium]